MIKNDWMILCYEKVSGIITGILCHCLMPESFGNMILHYDEKYGFVPASTKAVPRETEMYQKRAEIILKNVNEKKYLLTEYVLNEQNGDTYARWKESGTNTGISLEDLDYLNSATNYRMFHRNITVENGQVRYECVLSPYEVRGLRFVPSDLTAENMSL